MYDYSGNMSYFEDELAAAGATNEDLKAVSGGMFECVDDMAGLMPSEINGMIRLAIARHNRRKAVQNG